MTDEQLTALIQEAINKSAGELRKEMLVIDTIHEDLDKVKVEQKRLEGTCDDDYSVIHDELIDHQKQERESLTSTVSETIKKQDDAIKVLESSLFEKLNTMFNEHHVEQKVYIQEELIRLNNFVNEKLNTLKGDKGDCGAKGEKGDSGFIKGVSKWEAGHIAKRHDAISHQNSLWLCQCEETAREPASGSDEWVQLTDGIKNITLNDGELVIEQASGIHKELGRIGIVHRGDYKDGESYKINELTYLNGTTFIALKDNTDRPPGNCWKALATKGAKGNKGEPGPVTPPEDMVATIEAVVKGMKE